MKNLVITIGREYGSGGRYIAKQVAKKLNIPFYDHEIISKTYEKSGCNYTKLEQYDETKRNTLLKTLHLFNNNYDEAFEDSTYQELISSTVKDLAEQGACVILGRNANNILKKNKNVLNIFIYSNNIDFKVQRKIEIENISEEEAFKRLWTIDKKRKKYYESLNPNHIWGNRKEYDFCIDSSYLGIEKTIDLIIDIYKKKTMD